MDGRRNWVFRICWIDSFGTPVGIDSWHNLVAGSIKYRFDLGFSIAPKHDLSSIKGGFAYHS